MNDTAGPGDRGDGGCSAVSEPIPPALLDRDAVFESLAHPRRRLVCALLADRDEWDLDGLAAEIAARERALAGSARRDDSGVDEPGGDSSHRERVRVSLAHHHVPTLAETDALSYDDRTEIVRRGPQVHVLNSALAGIAAVLGRPDRRRP